MSGSSRSSTTATDMRALRSCGLVAAVLLLASCMQKPAPVRVADIAVPPLPGTPPAVRMATPPPLPGLKPEPPLVITAAPEPVIAAEPAGHASEDLLARIERILFAQEEEPSAPMVVLETVSSDTGPVSIYTVRAGDTLHRLARSFGVRSRDLADINGLVKPYLLVTGQELTIPQEATVASVEQAAAPEPAIPQEGAVAPPETADDVEVPEPVTTAVAEPEPKGNLQFIWPVTGEVVSAFGPKAGGLHNDGINIAAPAGTPVRAAEDGVVSYVGDEIRGYGNLVLLRHADGWVTAYAHNARNLVARGQMVLRGDVIASVGASGGVARPQSHFELRKGTAAVDPVRHLVEG